MDKDAIIAGVEGRYASALFDLAVEAGELDRVASDLEALASALTDSSDLRSLIRSPVFSGEDQARAMDAVLEKAGAAELTRRFVKIVAENRRLFALEGIIKAFKFLVARHRGEVSAVVTSAHPLTDAQSNSLAAELKTMLGRKIAMDVRVDPSLLGGVVVKVGSRMFDASLRTKLNRLHARMKEAS